MLIALLLVGWSKAARADGKLVQSYEVPEECPNVSWFEAELRKRSRSGVEPEGAVRVHIEREGSLYVGRVQRVRFESDLGTREVEHASCDQVVDALALIAALALAPDPSRSNSPAFPESDEARAEVTSSEPTRSSIPPGRSPRTSDVAGRASEGTIRVRHRASVGITARALVGPDVQVGARVGYGLLLSRGRYETELGVSFTRIRSGTIVLQGVGSAELSFSAGRARVCEAFRFVKTVALAPCAILDIGELRGRGRVSSPSASSQSRSALWASPGLLGKLEWRPWSLLALEANGGAFFPLLRPEFFFTVAGAEPSREVIWATPKKLGFSADLLVGLHFP